MNKGEYKFTKPQTEESFWPENENTQSIFDLDPKDFTIDLGGTTNEELTIDTNMSTEKGIAISTDGEYEMDAKGVINPTKPSENPLSEVEKPADDETLLQDKLAFWTKKQHELSIANSLAISKVKYYKSAIKAYEKAFKKLQED